MTSLMGVVTSSTEPQRSEVKWGLLTREGRKTLLYSLVFRDDPSATYLVLRVIALWGITNQNVQQNKDLMHWTCGENKLDLSHDLHSENVMDFCAW